MRGRRRPQAKARRPMRSWRSPGRCRRRWAEERHMPLATDEEIRDLLQSVRTIAMIGASDRPDRPSHEVMKALQDHGYRIIPLNPQITGEHVPGDSVWRERYHVGWAFHRVEVFLRLDAAG